MGAMDISLMYCVPVTARNCSIMEQDGGCQDCEVKENDLFIDFLKNWQQQSAGEPRLWCKINPLIH